jgi:serine/threonine-protein kinase
MTSTFSRLRVLFEQCVDIPEGERLLWIEQNVPDTTQRIELALMLAADSDESGFLQRDVVSRIGALDVASEEFEPENLLGRQFGAFELKRLLGQGGQGTVYLAGRVADDFRQTVAIKLLRRGIHDADEHRRFRREREILARFEHPDVARLIDGGVSGEGVPYLAMEYVDGLQIDFWCRTRCLDRESRLRLFSRLCVVVAAAHRALIVHRDLKPSNVLVTKEGAIKVLDFGIARLLDEEGNDAHSRTRAGMMTPGYGAPEQANGGTITLATDVHALGVLLRVLLTGEVPPFAPDAPLPELSQKLVPELRWIIGKATIAEAGLRYRDAAELDDDVRRFLDSRPVRAHPPSGWYRARKFVARHRGGMLVTAAFVVGILASLGLALWQAKVAREQAQRAQVARDFLLGVFEAANEDLPRDARPTPDVLAHAAAKKLESDTRLAPTTRADFLSTLGDIAKSSNDNDGALTFYNRALETLENNGDSASRQHLRIVVMRAWVQLVLGHAEQVEQTLQPRLDTLRSVRDDVAIDGLWAYSDARGSTGHLGEAVDLTREAAELANEVYPKESAEALRLSFAYSKALTDIGDLRKGNDVLQSTLDRWRAAGIPEQQDYSTALTNLALLKRRLGDIDGSIRLLREALALNRRIHAEPHEDIAQQMQLLGRILGERGDQDEAATLLDKSIAMLGALYGPAHPLSIGSLGARGIFDYDRQHFAESDDVLQRSAQICTEARLDSEVRCITNDQLLSAALLRLGRIDEAAAASARSIERLKKLSGEDTPDYAIALRARGDVLFAQGQTAAALATFDTILAIYARANIDENMETASAHASRARALLANGQSAQALVAIERAADTTERLAPRHRGRRLRLLATRAEVMEALGRHADAQTAAQEALVLEPVRAVLDAGEWEQLQALAR